MIIAGIGCKSGVSAQAVRDLVQEAAGLGFGQPGLLAAPAFRQEEPGLAAAAGQLGLPIIWISHSALEGCQGRCVTRSPRALAAVGLASVAEAAALAAAGPAGRLILPRIAAGSVTCALAQGALQ